MRVTRSKAAASAVEPQTEQQDTVATAIDAPLPSDDQDTTSDYSAMAAPDASKHQVDSPQAPLDSGAKLATPAPESPLPRLRESTNIANNPFVRNDKVTPSKSIKPHDRLSGHASTPGNANRISMSDAIHLDSDVDKPTSEHGNDKSPVALESKQGALLPKSPANQLLSKDRQGMRSTSNKENMRPGVPETVNGSQIPQDQPSTSAALATSANESEVTVDTQPAQHDGLTDTQLVSPGNDMVEIAITPIQETASHPVQVETKPPASKPRPSTSKTPRKSSMPDAGQRSEFADKPSANSAAAKTPVEIPHSKPRPMSMSFPAPKPPAKGTKPVTTSTFQLPGEAVAARLKAAKEARLNNQEKPQPAAKETSSADKRPAFKARPAPKFTASRDSLVRQTLASRARESLMQGAATTSQPASDKGPTKPRSSTMNSHIRNRPSLSSETSMRSGLASQRHSISTASKPSSLRQSTNARASISAQRRTTTFGNSTTVDSIPSRRQSSISVSTAASNPASRAQTMPPSPSAATQKSSSIVNTAARSRVGTEKGKAVFARASQALQAEAAAKREREDAAKRAREEASKRSRQMIKAWAEKQGKDKAKTSGKTSGQPPASVEQKKVEQAQHGDPGSGRDGEQGDDITTAVPRADSAAAETSSDAFGIEGCDAEHRALGQNTTDGVTQEVTA